jgi:hypothetical protein
MLNFAPSLLALPGRPLIHETREAWLRAAVAEIAPLFEEHGRTLPEVRVSVGWPGGKGQKHNVIGQCWHKASSRDGVAAIFISPVLESSADVLETLVHELVHAWDDNKSGHRGDFRKMALLLGLEGPMTATHAGEALSARLSEIADRLGRYPHGAMKYAPKTVGKGRMVKTSCGECGFISYTTKKWLEAYPEIPCPCGGTLEIG